MKRYENCKIFSKKKYEEIEIKMNADSVIGEVELDENEKTVLRMNPKFAVLQKLCSEKLLREMEIGFTKIKYEIEKRKKNKIEEDIEREGLDGKKRKLDKDLTSKENLIEEAKERQFYDPIEKTFDHSKKRVTDLQKCSMVYLPKVKDERTECEMDLIRNIMLEEFEALKKKIEKELEKKEKKVGGNLALDRNQEGQNLSKKEKLGLKKLQQTINKGEICVIKTDKSGKITAIEKEDYLKMGNNSNKVDRKIDRAEMKKLEARTSWG